MEYIQTFSWVDYVVFVLMLGISAIVGVYWGFFKKQTNQNDYLLGGRNMKVIPVAMSLVASFVSGITLLGSPTEVYMNGTQYGYIMGGILLMSIFMTQVYLPVFHELKLTSNYEYLSLRFDNKVRLFGSTLFVLTLIGWLPIVIYGPALAFNQETADNLKHFYESWRRVEKVTSHANNVATKLTGVNVHIITPIVCLVCIFYTSAGGLQAVVWTDVIQITAMLGAMALVAIKGTFDVGGFNIVWQRNMDTGRIELPDWDLKPTTRHTFWNLVFGGIVYWLQANSVNQTMVQRYLAIPTLRGAKWAVFIFCMGMCVLYCLCLYCGLLIFARFHDCDPLQTKLAKAKDQLLPLLVMDVLGKIPGLPGIFFAGIFSAALSSLSTSLNSMSAVVLEDFYKPFFKRRLTESQTNWLLKSVVVILGVLCLGLVFIVEKMGTILQLTMTLEAMTMGPQFGVFTLGILMPWVDSLGALAGGIVGLALMSWWCLSAQLAIVSGHIVHPHKPFTTNGCTYNFTAVDTTSHAESEEVNPILHVSYMWYTLSGALITIIVGNIVSKLNRLRGKAYVPPPSKLLAPQLRRLYKEPPHPTEDLYIKAYEDNKDNKSMKSTSIPMKLITECEEGS